MIVHCQRETLLEHANIVSKAISGRTTLSILECVLLNAENNAFKMTANDLELAIETKPIDADITQPGAVALEAHMFFEIVRRLPEGMVSIVSDENNVTTIRCFKSEFKILGLSAKEFPALPLVDRSHCRNINAMTLKNMIKKTIFAVSVDETKPIFMGELMEVKGGKLNIVAVDGFRVSYCKSDIKAVEDMSIIVPAKAMQELARILPVDDDLDISIYFTQKHVLMEVPNCTIVSRVLDGEFIAYDTLFDGDFSTVVIANRAEILSGVERAKLIATKEVRKNPVLLEICNGTITLSSQTELGAVTDTVSVDLDGNEISIAFNPNYLTDILKTIDDDKVLMSFTTPLSPCVIKGANDDNGKYLILPLRLNS